MAIKTNRLRELDFLRGIAILLVLCRHEYLFQFTVNMGWIGVDLFFVLSGFLVSGLLFKEYQKFGNIKPGNFLIRRGFKIYPVYYIFYIVYLIPIIYNHSFSAIPFLCDMIFVQNYYGGWGYAFDASWSLAVEEHFYFGLAILLPFLIKKSLIKLNVEQASSKISQFEIILVSIMSLCFLLRMASNIFLIKCPPTNVMIWEYRLFTMSHLRIDSLLAGVLISYLFYFRHERLKRIFLKHKRKLLLLSVALLSFTPFIDPLFSVFVKTFGFTMLYISFGIILVYILLSENINKKLDRLFGKYTIDLISRIGFCSYSIYIIHIFINYLIHKLLLFHFFSDLPFDFKYIAFPLSLIFSITCGKLMTEIVESFFLKLRDKRYPGRIT